MKKKYIWFTLLLIVVIGAAYGIREYTRGNEDLASATPDITIAATDLMSAYSSDENLANTKYLNKVVKVKGVVKDIKRDSLGSYSIDLESGSDLSVVSCLLDTRHNEEAKNLKIGDSAELTGMCSGMLIDVVLVRCAVQ